MNFKNTSTTKGLYELKLHKTVKTSVVFLVHFTQLQKPNYTVYVLSVWTKSTFAIHMKLLGCFSFVRPDRPTHSRHNENFTFNQNYPARSVKYLIVRKKKMVFQQKLVQPWSSQSVITFGKCPYAGFISVIFATDNLTR